MTKGIQVYEKAAKAIHQHPLRTGNESETGYYKFLLLPYQYPILALRSVPPLYPYYTLNVPELYRLSRVQV